MDKKSDNRELDVEMKMFKTLASIPVGESYSTVFGKITRIDPFTYKVELDELRVQDD